MKIFYHFWLTVFYRKFIVLHIKCFIGDKNVRPPTIKNGDKRRKIIENLKTFNDQNFS